MQESLDRYRLLGRSGLRVSPLCLGTMTFGTAWGWGADHETSRAMLERYAELGGNFIDSANVYTGGESETFVGELLAGRRERFVVATKYSCLADPTDPNSGGNHRKALVQSVEASLRRLRTERIDLLWVHAWDFRAPTEEVMRALDDLVRQGKVLYLGASDTPAWKIAEANTLARAMGWTPFIATQVHYNLAERSPEFELRPMGTEHGVALQPWSPLAGGILTGKYTRADLDDATHAPADSERADITRAIGQLSERSLGIAAAVAAVAAELEATPAQVALRWLLEQPGVTAPILGARRPEHLEDNLGCLNVALDAGQRDRLDAVSAPNPPFPNNFGRTAMFRGALDGELSIEGGPAEVYAPGHH
jgi:aryl-alcohol dehydrogenase-like predicted oxidoreductase